MAYDVLWQRPENGITERWEWETDVILANNGTEQRASLRAYPKREVAEVIAFDTVKEANGSVAMMLAGLAKPFVAPFHHFGAYLKKPAAAASKVLKYNPARTDIRVGETVFVYDREGWQLLTVATLDADGCHVVENITRTFRKGGFVCPASIMYTGNNVQLTRRTGDQFGAAQLSLQEVGFRVPFLSPANAAALTMFAGLPVLDRPQMGESFQQSFDTGIDPIDYGGVVSVRSPWTRTAQNTPRAFLCSRMSSPNEWAFWPKFADYARGSANPFYVPTWRADLPLVAPIAAGAVQFTTPGRDYADAYFARPTHKQVAIVSDGGTFYASVTAAAVVAGNTVVTIAAPYPAGAARQAGQRVGFLLKCRIADDVVTCQHKDTYSTVAINLRTVDA